nr:hypothetical protein [Tanacetum cinerariifolium]
MRWIYIDSSYQDDDEEDVDIDYSEGDELMLMIRMLMMTLVYEPDYVDEVVHRFGEIREQIMKDHWWYYFGGREVTHEMLLERLRIRNIEYVENMINLAFEYKRMLVKKDDDEEDVDTDYLEGDEVDADDSNADDGTLTDAGLLYLIRLQLVAAELFQAHDDDDDEGEDIDMYEELNTFYEPDYMDEVVHRFGEIREQIMEDHWWYYFGGREVTCKMLLERLRIRNIEYVENLINLAFEYKRMHGKEG